jgi:hypothetical protein
VKIYLQQCIKSSGPSSQKFIDTPQILIGASQFSCVFTHLLSLPLKSDKILPPVVEYQLTLFPTYLPACLPPSLPTFSHCLFLPHYFHHCVFAFDCQTLLLLRSANPLTAFLLSTGTTKCPSAQSISLQNFIISSSETRDMKQDGVTAGTGDV